MSKMLSSWKEIAHFFGKGVRTVQRWEKTLDLPIHRPPGAPSNVVLARTSDLEEWMHRGPVARMDEVTGDPVASPVSLDGLERELSLLAEISGVHPAAASADATAQERIALMTEVLGRVNTKLSTTRSAVRAA